MTFWLENVTTLRLHCAVDSYIHLRIFQLTWQSFAVLRFVTKLTSQGSDIFRASGEKGAVFVQFIREQISCLFKESSSIVESGEGLML